MTRPPPARTGGLPEAADGVGSSLVPERVRVVIGEDDVLLREGIARLLDDAGFDVVAVAGDADAFLRKAIAHKVDVAIVDVRMPPGWTDDGLRAAVELRRRRPETAVLVLSQYYESRFALDLIGDRAEGVGYLLKERVGDLDAFLEAVHRVAGGGSVLDPEVVARMLGRRSPDSPLALLTAREREVLAAMAEGKSNHGVAETLCVTEAAVEKHVTRIFNKFGLSPTSEEHRRVHAVLTFLRSIT
jgi:DNA-binding NarL/FixJ family response regulator